MSPENLHPWFLMAPTVTMLIAMLRQPHFDGALRMLTLHTEQVDATPAI